MLWTPHHQLNADLLLLEKAARHLRHIGWFGVFVVAGSIALVAIHMLRFGVFLMAPHLIFMGTILFTCLMLYFRMAHSITQGSRASIAFSLFLVSTFLFVVILRMLSGRHNAGEMIFETVFLLAHLNLVKLLWQGWGAAGRLRQWREPVVVYPVDELEIEA